MRVALVCDWFLPRMGGIELHLRDLALALRSRGLDARVLTTTPGADVVDGVPVHRVRAALSPVGRFAYTPAVLGRVADTLRTERFDVVHAHASVISPVAFAGVLAGARLGLPALLTFHSMLHRSAFLLGASEALLGWSRDRIVLSAVSSVVAAQAARWIPGGSVAVLPNGIDTAFWRELPRAASRSSDEIRFVSAMRLTRKKRPDVLLRAFAAAARFVSGTPRLRLVLAGDGPDRARLLRQAADLGIAGEVALPGRLSREALRELYARAHAFVLPSERESFGIAALEARTAGLPVIAMLASGARDFVQQGVDGVLARDEQELARAMSRLALDAPFRAYLARHNATTPPLYDWREVAILHERYYAAAAELRLAGERAIQR
jgi:glycosyltransferase involved in cell wall biosynthesis